MKECSCLKTKIKKKRIYEVIKPDNRLYLAHCLPEKELISHLVYSYRSAL